MVACFGDFVSFRRFGSLIWWFRSFRSVVSRVLHRYHLTLLWLEFFWLFYFHLEELSNLLLLTTTRNFSFEKNIMLMAQHVCKLRLFHRLISWFSPSRTGDLEFLQQLPWRCRASEHEFDQLSSHVRIMKWQSLKSCGLFGLLWMSLAALAMLFWMVSSPFAYRWPIRSVCHVSADFLGQIGDD